MSDENIIDFFKYVEGTVIFTPSTRIGPEGEEIVDNSRMYSGNYDKAYFNPAEIIDGLVTICKFDTVDKLLVDDYILDDGTIGMYIFIIGDFSSDPDDLQGVYEARQRAQWLVGRGDITWNDVPERLRPDFTGTFESIGLLGDFLPGGIFGGPLEEDKEEDK